MTVPVLDTIGIEYAFDLQVTQGFYVLVLAYATLRALQRMLLTRITRDK